MTSPANSAGVGPVQIPVVGDQKIRAWPKFPAGGQANYTALSLALRCEYETDAHFAAYSAPSIRRRLGKDALLKPGALAELASGVAMLLVIFDVDCPAAHQGDPHATDAWWLDEVEKRAALFKAHPNGFAYRTRGGYRVVYRLAEPIVLRDGTDAEAWSIRYCVWIAYLSREFEIAADPACKDWTRPFRLPHATRDAGGRPERRETIGDAESIGEWVCEPSKEDHTAARALCRKRERKKDATHTTAMAPTVPPGEGILVRLFAGRGWLGDEIEAGKWNAICPNETAHTKGSPLDGSTILYAPSPGEAYGWLHCSHAHCQGRGIRDVLGAFTEHEIKSVTSEVRARSSTGNAPVAGSASAAGETSERSALDAPVGSGGAPTELPVFERGDHAELADVLLEQLSSSRDLLVHDEGGLYRYEASGGRWRLLKKPVLHRLVKAFAGSQGIEGPLEVQVSDANGAITFAGAEVHREEFFSSAPRGVHFKNGFVVVTATGEIVVQGHSPDHRARSGFDFEHAPAAPCPRWLAFLAETFAGDADASAKISCIQEMGGAALLGIAPKYQKDVIFLGEGSNGKNVIIDVLVAAMPAGTTCAIAPQDWGNEYRLAMLAGKHLNVVSELPETDILSSVTFKAIITGDLVTGREIREAPFDFRARAAHVFAANQLPGTTDQSKGFWRRQMILSFNNVVPDGQQNPRLAEEILAAELPAIVRWLLDGASSLIRNGRYTLPPSSIAEIERWRRTTDVVDTFLVECTAPARTDDERIGAKELYRSYRDWSVENGHRFPVASNTFGLRMRRLGRRSQHTKRGNFYPLRLLAPGEPPPDIDGTLDEGSGAAGEGGEEGEGLPGDVPRACARARVREDADESPSSPSPSPQVVVAQGVEGEGWSFTSPSPPSPLSEVADDGDSGAATSVVPGDGPVCPLCDRTDRNAGADTDCRPCRQYLEATGARPPTRGPGPTFPTNERWS